MRRIATWLALAVLPACTACGGEVRATSPSAHLALVGATVIPLDDSGIDRIEDATVLVDGDSIVAVGPRGSIEIPAGARTVDARGRYLLPGFTDAHVHLRSQRELASYLRHGVTTVWNLSGTTSDAPDVLATRRAIADGELLGPTIYTTGPVLDGDPPIFAAVSTVVTERGAAERVVARQAELGYDFLKLYNGVLPDVMEAAIATADAHGMPVFGHVPRQPDRSLALQRALAAGLDVIAHGEEIFFTYAYEGVEEALERGEVPQRDEALVDGAVALVAESGAAVIPNLSFVAATRWQLDHVDELREDPESILADPETRYLSPDTRRIWQRFNVTTRSDLESFGRRERAKRAYVRRLTRALADAGVPLFAGTDASLAGLLPGRSLHLELVELVEAGLGPREALVAATRAPAEFVARHLEGAPRTGIVAVGARADLVLLARDPLEDIGNAGLVEGVVVGGRWFTSDELDGVRDSARAAAEGIGS